MKKHYSIADKLQALAEWWTDDKSWFTRTKLAEIIGCSETSLPSAFTWLRQNGYVVDNRRVYTKKVNLHRISRIDIDVLNQQVTRRDVTKTRSLLDVRVQRTTGRNVIPMKRAA